MLIKGGFMDTNRIIADIDTEISKLQQVRAPLSNAAREKSPGRPKSTEPKVTKVKKRKMSAKGRAAISAAMNARWAKKERRDKAQREENSSQIERIRHGRASNSSHIET
jgi:hypothetical protein